MQQSNYIDFYLGTRRCYWWEVNSCVEIFTVALPLLVPKRKAYLPLKTLKLSLIIFAPVRTTWKSRIYCDGVSLLHFKGAAIYPNKNYLLLVAKHTDKKSGFWSSPFQPPLKLQHLIVMTLSNTSLFYQLAHYFYEFSQVKCGCPLLIFLPEVSNTKTKFTTSIWMNILLIVLGLIYIVPKCISIITIGIRITSRWLCNSWIISKETREALIAMTFVNRFDLVTPMTGMNFMPTCWNGTLPFVMSRRFKMANLSSTHIVLEDFGWSNRNAVVLQRQRLQINRQQDDMLMGEGRITKHCRALLAAEWQTWRCGDSYRCPSPAVAYPGKWK